MKNILVPVDFSHLASEAVRSAQKLALRMKASVHLLHVLSSGMLLEDTGLERLQHQEMDASIRMREFVEENKLNVSKTFIRVGVISEVINECITENDIDMVVMHSAGATGLREFFVGSNTETVVRHAPVPVLTLKGGAEKGVDFSSIAIAGSFDREPPSNIEILLELQKAYNSNVHLIEVCVPENIWRKEVILRSMDAFAETHGLEHVKYHILEDFSVVGGIEKFIERQYIDVLAMATHQRHGFDRFFRSSIAESLVNHLPDAVLTFRLETEKAAT